MKSSLGRLSVLAVVLSTVGAAAVLGQSHNRHSESRGEAETFFGVMIAGKEIGRGVNATGGEQLIARLNFGPALGLRGGVHNEWLGLEASFLTTGNRAVVKNEFDVAFPNHAEMPLICSGDALLYPFRRAIKGGKVRPYLTSGVGGMLMSADLDNIQDKETHGRLVWNAGGGVKLFVRESAGIYLDVRFTNHRLLRGAAVNLQSISIGVGARF